MEACISPMLQYYMRYFNKESISSDQGKGWLIIRDQLYGNEISCQTLIRMSPEAFTRLCGILHEKYGLERSRHISLDEGVAIFLIICAQNDTQCDIALRFGHSQETIWRKFHEVLKAMERMVVEYIRPRTAQELIGISNLLQGDSRYWPYFNGFVGALDGTHVPVMVTPGQEGLRFINRKGIASINVLAICDFDMLFTYFFVRMAGSAHDARVLATAIRDDPMFPIPPESKYYLVDFGYANRRGYLTSYRKEHRGDTRYHLQEFLHSGPPRNSKEMYNRWHASLRSVIERTFGVWKKKWRVLNEFPRYDIATQRKVIFAMMGLHNFIRQHNIRDYDFDNVDNDDAQVQNIENDEQDNDGLRVEEESEAEMYMHIVRDQIAEQLWSVNQRGFRRRR